MSDNITNSGAGCCSPCGNQTIIVNTGNVNVSNTLYLAGDPPTRTLTAVGDGLISNMISTSSFYSPGFTSNSTTMRLTSNLQVTGSAYISDDLSVSNLTVRNTLGVTGAMTSNVDNTTFFYDTFTIPYLNTTQLVVTGNITTNTIITTNIFSTTANFSNSLTTTNVFATQGTFSNSLTTANVFATRGTFANSLTTTNVFATTLVGTLAGSNTIGGTTITAGTQFSGPGTGLTGTAASLSVGGTSGGLSGTPSISVATITGTQGTFTNLYSSNALTTTNVFATTGTLSNALTTNNIFVSNTLTVANAFTSNASNTSFFFNTFTVPFVNCTTLNVASVSNLTTATMQGIPGTTTLFVAGNAYVSNSLTTTNVFATQGTFTNLYSSNALTTTNVFATNIYGSIAGSNTIGGTTITASTQFSGPGTGLSGTAASLSVGGTSGGLSGTPNITVGTVGGTTITASTQFSGPGTGLSGTAASLSVGGTSGGLSGTPNITVGTITGTQGTFTNLYSSNALTTTNVFATQGSFSNSVTTNNVTVSNTLTVTNAFTSNATTTNFLFSTLTVPFVNCTTLNVASVSNLTTASMQGTIGSTTLFVTGNAYVSNSLTTTNVFAVTATVPGFTSQFTVNGGGTVTYSAAGNLLWGSTVLVIPAWKNSAYATAGYWDINCPTTGTIVYNSGTVTCTAAGIPVGGWAALYYRVVPGTSQASVQANFILKDQNDITYSPDSNWILLAVRNGTTNEIKWMPGNTTIPLGGTFYTTSASFDKVQVAGTIVVDSARTGAFTNLYSANALTTNNVFATQGTFTNLYSSNALTTTNVFATQGTFTNLYSSNALTTTNVFATQGTFSNALTTNNVFVSNTLTVANAFTSNATTTNFSFDTFTVPFVSCTTLNVASVSNLTTMTMQGTPDVTTLFVTGNAYVSNSVTASNLFATSNIGVGVTVPATTVQVNGQISSKSGGAYGILPPLTWRQGSSATNWNTAGPTNYSLAIGQPQMQCGSNTMVASPQTITFPLAYTNIPIVMITPYAISSNAAYVSSVTASNFQVTCPSNIPFEWLAIGN